MCIKKAGHSEGYGTMCAFKYVPMKHMLVGHMLITTYIITLEFVHVRGRREKVENGSQKNHCMHE